jgi:glycosyltransferase involved in cell wall biosynthesis
MTEKPVIICLTPVRNEAWILDTFLQCTSLWADHIIIADQQSTDGSREIALKYPKVILIENNSTGYDEFARQKILLNEARKISGKRLLITLDADEFFTASYSETDDWQKLMNAKSGDTFGFRWFNLKPGFKEFWGSDHFPWAFLDDNSTHDGKLIHSPRLPISPGKEQVNLEQIGVLHYQYTNWPRMESKHRYYQCLERINFPTKSPINIYRMYHHMYAVKKRESHDLKEDWFLKYELEGIGMRNVKIDKYYWFDAEVLDIFDKYGMAFFKREAIWNFDWNEVEEAIGNRNGKEYNDPRGLIEKVLHFWLTISQFRSKTFLVKKIDSYLNLALLKFN